MNQIIILLKYLTNCTGFVRSGKERTKIKTPKVITYDPSFPDLNQNISIPIKGGYFCSILISNRNAYDKMSDIKIFQINI